MTIEAVPFVNVIFENQILEDRISQLESKFQDKFDSLKFLIESLEKSILETVNQQSPGDTSQQKSLREEQERLRRYKATMDEIDEDVQASEAAANWLDKHREELIEYARQYTFESGYHKRQQANEGVSASVVLAFCEDLSFYLRWIAHYLRMMTPPSRMPRGVIKLVLPVDAYLDAFKLISSNQVKVQPNLSERAVVMLKSSIYRFLIKRDLEQDAL